MNMRGLLAARVRVEHAYNKLTDNLKTFMVVRGIRQDELLALSL